MKKQELKQVKDVTRSFEELQKSETKLKLFGGKGGVGKTTSAAATAVYLSDCGKRVLVLSSDPAPSLSDIFETKVGGDIVKIKENLYATEIDATQAVQNLKDKYGAVALNTISIFVPVEEDVLNAIPNEVVPGLDELFAMEKVLDFVSENEYEYIVWDTAPTGHTLRLLALPDIVKVYSSASIKLYARFSGVLNTVKNWFGKESARDEILDNLTELGQIAESVRKVLSDGRRTEFNIVLIPEALALYQSENLRQALQNQGITIKTMIINNVLPDNYDCKFCLQRRRMQQRYVGELRRKYADSNMEIIEMPLFPEEIKGLEAIQRYAEMLYRGEENAKG